MSEKYDVTSVASQHLELIENNGFCFRKRRLDVVKRPSSRAPQTKSVEVKYQLRQLLRQHFASIWLVRFL
jgi:hypothetical protein